MLSSRPRVCMWALLNMIVFIEGEAWVAVYSSVEWDVSPEFSFMLLLRFRLHMNMNIHFTEQTHILSVSFTKKGKCLSIKKPSWDDLWNCIWGSGRVSRDNRRLDTLFNCGLEGINVSQFLGYRRKILLVLFELLNYDNDCCYTQKKRLWSNLWFASYRWIQNFFTFFPVVFYGERKRIEWQREIFYEVLFGWKKT